MAASTGTTAAHVCALACAAIVSAAVAAAHAPSQPPWVPTRQVARPGYVQACGESLCLDGAPYHVKGMNWFLWSGSGPYDASTLMALRDDFAFMAAAGVNTVLINAEGFSYPNMTAFLDAGMAAGVRTMAYGLPSKGNQTLPDHPGLIGMDLCWECHIGGAGDRFKLQPQYNEWLLDRFGGSASAVHQCTGLPTGVSAGAVLPVPNDTALCATTPDPAVALFRQFVHDLYGMSFTQHTNWLRSTDPYHLYGFRNGFGGNGSPGVCPRFPLDLRTGARAMDFIAPEGYHFITSVDGQPIGPANATAIGVRGAFTYAYGDVGKPLLLFEYGYPLRNCSDPPACTAARKQQALFWADVVDMTARKNASGMFPWVFTEKNDLGSGSWGAVFNYLLDNSVNDTRDTRARDAVVAMCSRGPPGSTSMDLAFTPASTMLMAVGQAVGTGACASAYPMMPHAAGWFATANGTDGRTTPGAGVMTLCSAEAAKPGAAGLYVMHDDVTNASYACPVGLVPVGDFVPECGGNGGGRGGDGDRGASCAAGVDGRSISAGRLMMCASVADSQASAGLTIVHNNYGGLDRACASGTHRGSGTFQPAVMPVATETWTAYADALARFAPAPKRQYDDARVTVEPDEGAGRYVMWESGFATFGARHAEARPIGVNTSCTGTTSAAPSPPCIGSTFTGRHSDSATSGCWKACPHSCLNAELVTLFVRPAGGNASVQWTALDVYSTINGPINVAVPGGTAALQLAAQVGNTGEATWLPTSAGSGGGVKLACNGGRNGGVACEGGVVAREIPYLDTVTVEPFTVTLPRPVVPGGGGVNVTLQMGASLAGGTAWFGPTAQVVATAV